MLKTLREFYEYLSSCGNITSFAEFPRYFLSIPVKIVDNRKIDIGIDREIFLTKIYGIPIVNKLMSFGLLKCPLFVVQKIPSDFLKQQKSLNNSNLVLDQDKFLWLVGYFVEEKCSYIEFKDREKIQLFFHGIKITMENKVLEDGVLGYDIMLDNNENRIGNVIANDPTLLTIVISDLLEKANYN